MSPVSTQRLTIAKTDIVRAFEDFPSKVLTLGDIERLLIVNRQFWRLAKSTTTPDFVDYLLKKTKLKLVELKFPHKRELRFTWGDVSVYQLAFSLKRDSYFTHYTAMYLHQLTEQIPKTIYLNYEQPKKTRRLSQLSQERIDFALGRPARASKNIAAYDGYRICILNGMYTGQLGVVEIIGDTGEKLRLTSPERTLIDIAVRPQYSGGVHEVLKAYKHAVNTVSVTRLVALLKKLNYIYPYHQVIGFYLERAGVYKYSVIQPLRKMEMKYDFYLYHNMSEMSYSKDWRLFFPKGF